jgi:hypothetical protein
MQPRLKTSVIAKLRDALADEIKSIVPGPPKPVTKELKKSVSKELKFLELSSREKKAGEAILHFWRMSNIVKKLYTEDGYQTYRALFSDMDEKVQFANEVFHLALLMFGRTIADVRLDLTIPKNPFVHANALYHRDDDLISRQINNILKQFEFTTNTCDYDYFPVSLLATTPLKYIIDTYLKKGVEQKALEVLKKPDANIAFIKIKKNTPDLKLIRKNLKAAGIIASPWQLAQYSLEHKTTKIKFTKNAKPSMFALNAPRTSKEFIEHPCMELLSEIGESSFPTKNIAICLRRMLSELLKQDIPTHALERIFIFLNVGNKFYKNNYERFAMITYSIIHEMTILLLQNPEFKNFITYSDFKEHTLEHNTSALGLDAKSLTADFYPLAFTANSGTHAFTLAMQLASQMSSIKDRPKIEVLDPLYYEFNSMFKNEPGDDADIFVLSIGPIVNGKGEIEPGVNINEFVKKRNLGKAQPITLVIDATSGLAKNLKLDDEVLALMEKGFISILVFESHQKFGLLHSDQAQYGKVFGIGSKKSFTKEIIDEFEKNAAIDLQSIPDMKIGAFIEIAAGEFLEKIKQQHFKNADILRNVFQKLGLESAINAKPHALSTTEDLLFNVIPIKSPWFFAAAHLLKQRDSFGHFTSTICMVNTFSRICMSASDTVDALIEASKIYLFAAVLQRELIQPDFAFLLEKIQEKKSAEIADQIIILAMSAILEKNLIYIGASWNEKFQLFINLKYFIDKCDATMLGRSHFNLLFKNFQYQLNLPIECGITFNDIFNHMEKLKTAPKELASFMEKINNFLDISDKNVYSFALNQSALIVIGAMRYPSLLKTIKEFKPIKLDNQTAKIFSEATRYLQENKSIQFTEQVIEVLLRGKIKIAECIIRLAKSALLDNKILNLLLCDTNEAIALFLLISRDNLNPKAVQILTGDCPDFKETNTFAETLVKLDACVLSPRILSQLILNPTMIYAVQKLPLKSLFLIPQMLFKNLSKMEIGLELSNWPLPQVRKFYHFLKDDPLQKDASFNKVLRELCNERFYKGFSQAYKSQHTHSTLSLLVKSSLINKIYSNKPLTIDQIEAGAQESKEINQILKKSV